MYFVCCGCANMPCITSIIAMWFHFKMSALFDRLVVNETFQSFEEIELFVERLASELFMPCRIKDSKTIETYNNSLKNVDYYLNPKLRFQHALFVCSHFGNPRDRSKGKRTTQYVRACKCNFYFKVVYQRGSQSFRITDVCREHQSHPMSESTIETFRVKE
jgi:hypothetical protein